MPGSGAYPFGSAWEGPRFLCHDRSNAAGRYSVRHIRRWATVSILILLFLISWGFQWWNERDMIAWAGWNRLWFCSFAAWNVALLSHTPGWALGRTLLDDVIADQRRLEAKIDLLLVRNGIDARSDRQRAADNLTWRRPSVDGVPLSEGDRWPR